MTLVWGLRETFQGIKIIFHHYRWTDYLRQDLCLQRCVLQKVNYLQIYEGFYEGCDIRYPTYAMRGQDPVRDWSLVIENISLEDDGIFQCQV